MARRGAKGFFARLVTGAIVFVAAGFFTISLFFVLPLIQAIADGPRPDTQITDFDTGEIPAPDVMEEEQKEEPPEEEEEIEPPDIQPDVEPLSLDALDGALNATGIGSGFLQGDFKVDLKSHMTGKKGASDEIFGMNDLDSKPRVIYQPGPTVNKAIQKKAPGKAWVLFIVDKRGRVSDAKIQKSTHPIFEKSALNCVRKWKFEPAKRKGQAVSFRMRVPITFPEGL